MYLAGHPCLYVQAPSLHGLTTTLEPALIQDGRSAVRPKQRANRSLANKQRFQINVLDRWRIKRREKEGTQISKSLFYPFVLCFGSLIVP